MNFLIFSILSLSLTRAILPYLSKTFIDNPNYRSSHKLPTPRGGGLVFSSLICFYCIIKIFLGDFNFLNLIPLISIPLCLVSLLDDYTNVSSLKRFSIQLATIAVIAIISPLLRSYNLNIMELVFIFIFVLISGTSIINFTNFMDGIDGLIAGCMCIIFITSAILISPLFWVLSGSILGFLILNWNPAKVFMGDIGSTFLGAVFVGIILSNSSLADAFGFLLLGTPFLADAFICIPRRWFSGQNIFEPHKSHLYQRLNQSGLPHSSVSSLYIIATAILSASLIFQGFAFTLVIALIEVIIGLLLDKNFAVQFDSL